MSLVEEFRWSVARESGLPAPHEIKAALENGSVSELHFALNAQRKMFSKFLDDRISKLEALLQKTIETKANNSLKSCTMAHDEHSGPSFTAENVEAMPKVLYSEEEFAIQQKETMQKVLFSEEECAIQQSVDVSPILDRDGVKKLTDRFTRIGMGSAEAVTLKESISEDGDKLQNFVHHASFDSFFAFVIVCNSIFIGYRIHIVSSTLSDDEGLFTSVASIMFTSIFTVELIVRLIADRCRFFYRRNPDFGWNIFDITLVAISLLGLAFEAMELVHSSSDSSARTEITTIISHGRIMRILRLIRILKIVRSVRIIRFVYSLRIFVLSILSTLTSLFWALVLLFLLFYSFGAAFTARVNGYLIDAKNSDERFAYVNELEQYWGNLPKSVLTLYMCITGGIDWREPQYPLHVLGDQWVFLFLVFVSFSVFAVLNVVTGFFCQNAIATACNSEEVLIFHDHQQHVETLKRLKRAFKKIDEDHSGDITYHELEKHLYDDQIQAVFRELQIGGDDAYVLFKMLSIDKTISPEDFVAGLMRSRGVAKRIDVFGLTMELKKLQRYVKNLHEANQCQRTSDSKQSS